MVNAPHERMLHTPAGLNTLPKEWYWARLDEVCDGIFDCPHSTPTISPFGPLMVRSQDIRTGFFRVDEAAHVSEETYCERTRRTEPRYGDLFYSREGTYFGIAAEVPAEKKVCLGQRMVLIRPNARIAHYRFLRYWLNSHFLAAHVYGFKDGSVAERLNLPTIRALPVAMPPMAEQQAIAYILGSLDDKTEINRRMNATLEAMARALFRSWFVDFDPVQAKAAGQQPDGMDSATAALFPDSFVDSPLGRVPKDWKVRKLSEVVELAYGKALKDTDRLPGAIPVYGSNGQVGWHCEASVKGPGIIVGRKGNPGIVTRVMTDFFPIDTTFYIKWITDISFTYLYFTLGSLNLSSLGSDSAVPGLNRNIAYMSDILVPCQEVLTAFEDTVIAFFRFIHENDEQSTALGAIRNLLLPKLLSGEIRVQEIMA